MQNQIPKNWQKLKLKDIAKFQYGYTAEAIKENIGPKLLRITDIVKDAINWNCVPHCRINSNDYKKFKLYDEDIVTARIGATAGYAKYIKAPPDSVFASYLIRIRPDKKHDKAYLGKLIESGEFKRFIDKTIGGSAQPQANVPVIKNFEFLLPPLATQKKISSFLLKIESLIENNKRKIEILEKMARLIYREWFVEFRFLGYKRVKFADSELGKIPECWQPKKLVDVLSTIESGSRPKGGIDVNETEIPSIGAENILGLGKYNYSKEKYISKKFFENMTSGIIKNKDVLLYKDGAKIGRKSYFRNNFPQKKMLY